VPLRTNPAAATRRRLSDPSLAHHQSGSSYEGATFSVSRAARPDRGRRLRRRAETRAFHPYLRAGPVLAVPFRRRPRRLSANERAVNRSHARNRGPGERAVATIKTWKLLTQLRCCPRRAATTIIAAIRVLQTVEDRQP